MRDQVHQASSLMAAEADLVEDDLNDVADLAHLAAGNVMPALGVTVATAGAAGAPLVWGAPSLVAARLRGLMVDLVRTRGADSGAPRAGRVLEVRAAPVDAAPAWLRVALSYGGAVRELTLPIAGAVPL